METLVLAGYGLAIVIGVTMGLLGGGGSILTVPVFVYFLGINPVLATAYSLFVIGTTSMVGAGRSVFDGNVNFRIAVGFAVPSFISIYLTRRFLIPALPEVMLETGDFLMTKGMFMMLFFALLMLVSAVSMIKGRTSLEQKKPEELSFSYPKIASQGAVVGLLAGMVGAGGGFLIIPALVLFSKVPMKMAIGTTLLIISFNSLIGFMGDVQNTTIDWSFLLPFTGFAIIGILIGVYLTKFFSGSKLKKGFGVFVLAVAAFIVIQELVLS